MKTLLLRPFVDSTTGTCPPLSIMYLSSYLKSNDLDVKLMDYCVDREMIGDFSLKNKHIKQLINDITKYNPDIIGMTVFSRELKDMSILCQLLKKTIKTAFIVLGGPHATAMPNELLEQIPECDFVTRGEGEKVLYDLIMALSKDEDLKNVKGISFRNKENNQIHHCEDAEIISDLDALPFPDRTSLIHNYKNSKYGSILYGSPTELIITSRGCPFKCNFCFKVCEQYRSRSPENILAEIDWIIKNISPAYIQIMDDSFTIQKDRCTKVLDLLIEKNYSCKFKIRSRVNAVDEELLKKMKQAGVDTIVYGFESGSQKMLDAFNKKTSVEQNTRACQLTKKAGINCFGDMILFYPGENRETLKETVRFVKKAKPTGVKFYVLTPLPKTKVYDDFKKSGSMIGGWNLGEQTPWIKLDEFKDINEMQKLSRNMFIKTLLSPPRIWWIFKMFAKSFLKNPQLTLKWGVYSIIKKSKY